MSTTMPPTIPPRVIEHGAKGRRERLTGLRLPEGTWRGVLAGAEAAVGSWLVVIVVAVASYVATAAVPELGEAGWVDAARVGSALWLLAHGGQLLLVDAAITVVPLGVTVLACVVVSASVRRARLSTIWPLVAAGAAYTTLAAAFAFFAATPGTWLGVVGAPAVVAVGIFAAQRGRVPKSWSDKAKRLPIGVRDGWSAALRAVAGLAIAGLLVLAAGVVLGFSEIVQVHDSLVPDVMSTILMAIAQLLLVPTLVVWGGAFVLGPGFAIGDGTLFSSTQIVAGPLPVVPVLGALPQPGSLAQDLGILVVVGIVVGLGCGWWIRRRELDLRQAAIAVATCGAGAGAAWAVLAWASSGSVGPGSMTLVGPDPLAVGVAALWQVLAGATLVALVLHRDNLAVLRRVLDEMRAAN